MVKYSVLISWISLNIAIMIASATFYWSSLDYQSPVWQRDKQVEELAKENFWRQIADHRANSFLARDFAQFIDKKPYLMKYTPYENDFIWMRMENERGGIADYMQNRGKRLFGESMSNVKNDVKVTYRLYEKPLRLHPKIQHEYTRYTIFYYWFEYGLYAIGTCFLLSALIYTKYLRHQTFSLGIINKLPFEVTTILCSGGIVVWSVMFTLETRSFFSSYTILAASGVSIPEWNLSWETIVVFIAFASFFYVWLHSLIQQSTYRHWRWNSLIMTSVFFASLLILFGASLGQRLSGLWLVLGLGSGLAALIFISRYVSYMAKIVYYARLIGNEQEVPNLPVHPYSPLGVVARVLNVMKDKVDWSHDAQRKSEQFKTELISNVSHDLRTPLTSIMTYTDLLKDGKLAPEKRQDYVHILDRKAKRLKVLIDDLFEVTKMATGNVQLERERIDLVQLLQQALGEHDDTLNAQELQVRLAIPKQAIFLPVDGNKMWRVFDNVLGNIAKYAQPSTRVYVSLVEHEQTVVLQFKNISRYELGDNVEQLLERFKRGDTSRHTEGSGLGLAIVQTIVDLHGGTIDVAVDGDLFKITLELRKE